MIVIGAFSARVTFEVRKPSPNGSRPAFKTHDAVAFGEPRATFADETGAAGADHRRPQELE
ncbi:MAG: hypothetical protein GVY27_04940 [Deinococcus-Thermus bacterium]|jgi:hypothetical protein|nr:hypothetical protein [Deinococcota bacterium]